MGIKFRLFRNILSRKTLVTPLWMKIFLQTEYCNADRTKWKSTLQDINTTSQELKRDCSHRQLFWGLSVFREIYPNVHEATLAD